MAEYQIVWRRGISERVYQKPVIRLGTIQSVPVSCGSHSRAGVTTNLSPGVTAASRAPRKNLFVRIAE
jgi:hypothetical protein